MKRDFPITIIILAAIFFLSCSPKYYVPTTQNVPLIHAKGQTNLTAAGNSNQAEFQGAYGVSNSVALQASAGFLFPQDENNGNGGSGNFLELGAGYYKNLNPQILFDVYGLMAYGRMENHFPTTLSEYPGTTGKISANLFRFGIQPGISYHSKYFSVTGSARMMSLNYGNIEGNFIFESEDQVAYLKANKSSIVLEPALTIRGGLEKVKLQVQLLGSSNLNNSKFRQEKSLLSVGLNFNF